MKVSEALLKRRSIKAYDTEITLSEDEIRTLLSLALETPSSFNIQHWRLCAVTDPGVRKQISEAAWNQAHLREAPLVVAIAADPKAWKDAERYWRNSSPEVQAKMAGMIRQFYQEERLQRDEAIRSGSLLAMSLMLAATERGWDTCPMIGFDPVKVKQILAMPEDWIPVMLVTVGKGVKPAHPKSGQMPYEEIVFRDSFV
ncbi:MAG: nitroreductase family protein [Opitutales bacterium]|nr:nitroreductase family protein [Opitutales bacterium]MCH8540439.1 nitroreductase family protein [Opitutales bacterium]